MHGRIPKSTKIYRNNKFKMSALTRNEKFELPDGSYSLSSHLKLKEDIIWNI